MKKLIFQLLMGTLALTNKSFSQGTNASKSLQNGQSIYATYCMSCHMENGEGLPGTFPSLVKTGDIKDKNKLVKIILQGMKEPTKVNGVEYATEMVGISISDQEITDVINYIRNSWGNKFPMVKVSEILVAKKSLQ